MEKPNKGCRQGCARRRRVVNVVVVIVVNVVIVVVVNVVVEKASNQSNE